MTQSGNRNSRANLNIVFKITRYWLFALVILSLLSSQAFSLTLTPREFGEELGVYLGAANASRSLAQEQCVDTLNVPDRYREAEIFIHKQLLKRKFTSEDAHSLMSNPQLLKILDDTTSTYVVMLGKLDKQFGHPVGCGMILGILQGIMQSSSMVIKRATITKSR